MPFRDGLAAPASSARTTGTRIGGGLACGLRRLAKRSTVERSPGPRHGSGGGGDHCADVAIIPEKPYEAGRTLRPRPIASSNFVKRSLAGFGAALAGLGADAAMLVFSRMPLALLPAFLTGLRAGLDRSAEDFHVGARAARCHCARRRTDVGTVEVEPNALPQLIDHRLGKAPIRTGSAGLSAAVALLDAPQQLVGRAPLDVRVGADHFSNVHGSLRCRCQEPEERTPPRYVPSRCGARPGGAYRHTLSNASTSSRNFRR